MTLSKTKLAAALAAALTIGAIGPAAAEETAPMQLRSHVKSSSAAKASDPRPLPGAMDLFHQMACNRAADLLADGQPGASSVRMMLWRQEGPADETRTAIPQVTCDRELIAESPFTLKSRVVYPNDKGRYVHSRQMSLSNAVHLAGEMANRVGQYVLATGEAASITLALDYRQKSVRQVIVGLAKRHGVDPGFAVGVAQCESGLNPRANSGRYVGLFQHDAGMWPERARRYGHPGASPFDPVANTDVSLRMAKAQGWGHWGCA